MERDTMKKALIVGCNGQDGAWLASHLLKLGYVVHGMVRRGSTDKLWRLRAIDVLDHPDFHIVSGDLTDPHSIYTLAERQFDEWYNLGAQSFVKESFNSPVTTFEINAMGVVHSLEAIRRYSPKTRFYQAGTSEQFGHPRYFFVKPDATAYMSEETEFHPRSPYGVSKVAAHHAVQVAREAYGVFGCVGILFNHECLEFDTPVITKDKNGIIEIVKIGHLVPFIKKGKNLQTKLENELDGLQVWDGLEWATIKSMSAIKRRKQDDNHQMLVLQCRAGAVGTTAHHRCILDSKEERRTSDLEVGVDKLLTGEYPVGDIKMFGVTESMAHLLGLLCSDGYVGDCNGEIRFTNKNIDLLNKFDSLMLSTFGMRPKRRNGKSGYTDGHIEYCSVYSKTLAAFLRERLYTKDGYSRVPIEILNGSIDVKKAFIDGYYEGDGLKNGNSLSFKSNSSILSQGLLFLMGKDFTVYRQKNHNNKNLLDYYYVNWKSDSKKGRHLLKSPDVVRRIDADHNEHEWVFDIETSSGKIMAGVGRIVVHNSELRGEEFVTTKVCKGAIQIARGQLDRIHLGNFEAQRDWGYAPDYVRAMRLMLLQDQPDDYVLATEKTRSIRELCEVAFAHVGLKGSVEDYVAIDNVAYKRPADVEYLRGDATKARSVLGWKPEVSFEEMIGRMCDWWDRREF